MASQVFTIGHSNHDVAGLLALLNRHQIDVVVDVRSSPHSRYSPHFNRPELAAALNGHVRYAWMGDSLGGRPPSPEFYDEAGHVLYGPLSRTPEFIRGLEQLESNAARYRIALLCAEADPSHCHRHLLVARSLRNRGWPADRIVHILGDGALKSDAELPAQALLLEDAWRSPLSVSQEPAQSRSSNG